MIQQKLTYTCSICDKLHEQKYNLRLGSPAVITCLPPEWRAVEGALICDDHEIWIFNKNKLPSGIDCECVL